MPLPTRTPAPAAAVWAGAIDTLAAAAHPVDAAALRIWFAFFPLPLAESLARPEDRERLLRMLRLEGRYTLVGQAHTSHRFLYGHRHWAAVVRALHTWDDVPEDPLAAAQGLAVRAAGAAADAREFVAIAAVALMTRQQLGLAGQDLDAPPPDAVVADGRTAAAIVAARQARRVSLSRLWGAAPVHRITFDERRPDGRFDVLGRQELTSGAAADGRSFDLQGRLTGSGPIPTDCRSGTCGTCWVGVIAGADRLSEVEPNEARRLRACGYSDSTDTRPLIRLACLTRASGDVSIVVPPWNGVLGRYARPGLTHPAEGHRLADAQTLDGDEP